MQHSVPRVDSFVDGVREPSNSPRCGELRNPGTGELLARVPFATRAEVDEVVASSAAAFPGWRDTPVVERCRILFRYKQLLEEHLEEVADWISRENGKIPVEARGSVRRGIEVVEFACGMSTLIQGSTVENVSRGLDCASFRQPLGVCAGITPFNFPAMVPMWLYPVAIACGNTFVLKPSEKVPGAALRLAELFVEAGLPPGVFNVVQGDREAVEALVENPDVRAVSFVGSAPVARYVYEAASMAGKRVQALAGAKNHLVAMPDCNLDKTADAIIGSAFGSAGERCMAISAVVTVGEVHEPLLEKVKARAASMRLGAAAEGGSDLGPLISGPHRDRVLEYIETGLDEGAQLALDGRCHSGVDGLSGYFLGPSIFEGVSPKMKIYQDEIFGPVLSVIQAEDLDEAINVVNANRFGNGTAIFTESGWAAREYQNRVQVGMVGINVGVPVPLAFFSFSGWRGSFFGDLHAHGRDGVNFYTEQKVVSSRWFGSD